MPHERSVAADLTVLEYLRAKFTLRAGWRKSSAGARSRPGWSVLLLVALFACGAYLRFVGSGWGEGQFLHPDERFLTWVTTDIAPTKLSGYFDTKNSSLNPHNRGHKFFVYGTLPLFAVRHLSALFVEKPGFGDVAQVGRTLAAITDLFTALLVYLLAARIANRKAACLAVSFYLFAVLPIQLSHYYKEDIFASFFCVAAIYCAARLSDQEHGRWFWTAAWAICSACAAASKLNAGLVVLTWPVVLAIRSQVFSMRRRDTLYLSALAATAFLVTFRIFQPYAFVGPGFFGVQLNPAWLSNMQELWAQTSGMVDSPPALQWARRSPWFALQNLVLWGLGPGLGFLCLAAMVWTGWRIVSGDWRKFMLPWGWALLIIGLTSLSFVPTMRYLLPAYPALAIVGGCASAAWWNRRAVRIAVLVVVCITGAWAIAFSSIYTAPVTRIAASRWILSNVPAPIQLVITSGGSQSNLPLPFGRDRSLIPAAPYEADFEARSTGTVVEVRLPRVSPVHCGEGGATCVGYRLRADLIWTGNSKVVASGSINAEPKGNSSASEVKIRIDPAAAISKGERYRIRLTLEGAHPGLKLAGAVIANESTWDDALPLRIDGHDPFGGLYPDPLNFEMYWAENGEKLSRFLTNLERADYIFISSNRQWGTVTRVPERYPLATTYYRELLGCPAGREVEWCYRVAQVGTFTGTLGFELVRVFESRPRLGPFSLNDQFAEEAFTVYDHPKVFIFRKLGSFDASSVQRKLSAVDLTQVVNVLPAQAGSFPANLMLPAQVAQRQQAGGTFRERFDPNAIVNRSQWLSAAAWYLMLSILGWCAYILLRVPFAGLPDRGYPLMKAAGLLLLSYMAWLGASIGLTFSRGEIAVLASFLIGAASVIAWLRRSELLEELRERKRYLIGLELLFLFCFVAALLVRYANPDLWHPWRGGEKPMDFSMLNAVMKSTSFPPYDPWFAGGYVNYYYFGFVLAAVPAVALGIPPSVAFNLVIATLFAMIAAGAFSLGWNVVGTDRKASTRTRWRAGLTALIAMALAGNIAITRVLTDALATLGRSDSGTGPLSYVWYVARGVKSWISGADLPLDPAQIYWAPSRAITVTDGSSPITEFPYFTFLLADPHAHFFALPLALLVLTTAAAALFFRDSVRHAPARFAALLTFAALCTGSLRVTNTWDFYPYLLLVCCAFGYSVWSSRWGGSIDGFVGRRFAIALAAAAAVTCAAVALYAPFFRWFGSGYGRLILWKGEHTQASSWFLHWGIFLFAVVSWLAVETFRWMAQTRLGELRRMRSRIGAVLSMVVAVVLVGVLLRYLGVAIAAPALALIAWIFAVALAIELPLAKKAVLCTLAFGLMLTLLVEVAVLHGDIGRMNTVFKVYLQAWTLLSIGAACALTWTLTSLEWRRWPVWTAALIVLSAIALSYPIFGTKSRIADRMATEAPRSLDGMAFLAHARYSDNGAEMDLAKDLEAIRWMQQNVDGSPVIVEANLPELYRWGSRFSVYTGLPGVVGWDWHQRQQRAVVPPEWVRQRIDEVNYFYTTSDIASASAFLRKYGVRYIVLGQQELIRYRGLGLAKFEDLAAPWKPVYRDGDTVIYRVKG